jgi:hypothetical protein
MSAFHVIQGYAKMLRNLDTWLGKAAEHASAKKYDPNTLVGTRLYPDMYALDRQVQSACDTAKFAAAYLTGKEAPKHPDTEKTIDELRARIAAVLGWIETVKETDFAGGDERKVAPAWLKGKWLRGDDYLGTIATPNFFFHVTIAYAILRHSGVDLGKMDYIGSLPLRD